MPRAVRLFECGLVEFQISNLSGVHAPLSIIVVDSLSYALVLGRAHGSAWYFTSLSHLVDGNAIVCVAVEGTQCHTPFNDVITSRATHSKFLSVMRSSFAAGCGSTITFYSFDGSEGGAAASGVSEDLSFSPHAQTVNSGVFNHNQQVLASASEDGTISLNVIGSSGPKSLGTLPKAAATGGGTAHNGKGVTSLTFSQGSRYLGSGGNDGTVKLWDLKQADTIRFFDQHRHAVKCVALNAEDSYIVSADVGGALLMNRVLNKQTIELGPPPPSGGELQAYTSIHFSKLRPESLATATDGGTIAVWDTREGVRTHCWDELHFAPATTVRCCPDDGALLCSGGLDKRLLFLDVRAPSHDDAVVQSANVDAPISAVEWVSSGGLKYVVVGTTIGTLSAYDVRMALHPCARAAAPRAARAAARGVAWIAPRRAQLRSRSDGSSRRVQAAAPAARNAAAVDARALQPPASIRTPSPQLARAQPRPPPAAASDAPAVRVSRHGSIDIRPRRAAAVRFEDEAAAPPRAPTAAAAAAAVPKPDLRPTSTQRAAAVAETRAAAAKALPLVAAPPAASTASKTAAADASSRLSAAAAAAAPRAASASGSAAGSSAAAIGATSGSGGFSLEGVARSMLQDELGDLRQTLHDDVQNMHLELIRQFQVQQQTLLALFTEQMGELSAVVDENARLRRENERLSVMYE